MKEFLFDNIIQTLLCIAIIYYTYTGYKRQKKILKSLFSSLIFCFGFLVSISPFLLFFYLLPITSEMTDSFHWIVKTLLIIAYTLPTTLISISVASIFWSVYDNYLETGIIKFELKKKSK